MHPTHRACGKPWVPAFAGMTPGVLQQIYPRTPNPAVFSPRPPHRSEIMTSGWCGEVGWGGSRAAPGPSLSRSTLTLSRQGRAADNRHGRNDHRPANAPAPPRKGVELPAWKRPVWRHTVDLARGDKVPGAGAGVWGHNPSIRSGQAQNPDRPARREPHHNCGLPARGKRLAGPASFSRGAREWFFDILRGQPPPDASACPTVSTHEACAGHRVTAEDQKKGPGRCRGPCVMRVPPFSSRAAGSGRPGWRPS